MRAAERASLGGAAAEGVPVEPRVDRAFASGPCEFAPLLLPQGGTRAAAIASARSFASLSAVVPSTSTAPLTLMPWRSRTLSENSGCASY